VFSDGPNPNRYYFAGGDHWIAQENENGSIALKRKHYRWLQFFGPCFVMPALIFVAGLALYFATGNQAALFALASLALITKLIVFFIYRIEWVELHKQPVHIFEWHPSGKFEIMGVPYTSESKNEITLQYSFFQSGTARGFGAFSELDVVIDDGSQKRKINILSQKSNWALKHARRLHQFTQIPLARNVFAK